MLSVFRHEATEVHKIMNAQGKVEIEKMQKLGAADAMHVPASGDLTSQQAARVAKKIADRVFSASLKCRDNESVVPEKCNAGTWGHAPV